MLIYSNTTSENWATSAVLHTSISRQHMAFFKVIKGKCAASEMER